MFKNIKNFKLNAVCLIIAAMVTFIGIVLMSGITYALDILTEFKRCF